METRITARTRLSGGLLVAGAIVGAIANAMHPHTAEDDIAVVVSSIAESGEWVWVHLALIVTVLLLTFGLTGLATVFEDTSAQLGRMVSSATVVGAAVVLVSTAIDGFTMKWLTQLESDAFDGTDAAVLGLATVTKEVNDAVWSVGMLTFFGLTFLLFGIAARSNTWAPPWVAWGAFAGGAGSTIAALIQVGLGGEAQAAETLFLISSVILTIWAIATGVLLWRTPRRTLAATVTGSG